MQITFILSHLFSAITSIRVFYEREYLILSSTNNDFVLFLRKVYFIWGNLPHLLVTVVAFDVAAVAASVAVEKQLLRKYHGNSDNKVMRNLFIGSVLWSQKTTK